jgi:hypothetical protein
LLPLLVAERNTANSSNANNRVPIVGKDHGNSNGSILNNHRNNINNNNNNNNHNINNNNNNNNNNHNHVVAAREPNALSLLTATSQHQFQKLPTREQEVQVDLGDVIKSESDSDDSWTKQAGDAIQALAITVQYFTHQVRIIATSFLDRRDNFHSLFSRLPLLGIRRKLMHGRFFLIAANLTCHDNRRMRARFLFCEAGKVPP